MDRKTFSASVKLDERGAIVAAFAQLNVVDHDGDVTLPGAFPSKSVPLSAYNHGSWDGAMPVGAGAIAEEGGWAVFRGRFFLDTTHGRDAYETVKGLGPLCEYSYGYQVLDSERGVREGKAVRILKSLDVFEVSPVLVGAGIGTHTRDLKAAGRLRPADLERIQREAIAGMARQNELELARLGAAAARRLAEPDDPADLKERLDRSLRELARRAGVRV